MANNNVTGFNIGGETKKIDYNELANKPFEDLGTTTETLFTNLSVKAEPPSQ